MTEGTEDGTDPIDALAEDFLVRHRRGERPKAEDYAARHPGLAEQIHELFPALLVMENLSPSWDTAPGKAGGEAGVLGDFRIVREVGRGGMGVVYEAVQLSLGRRVALKVLPPALAASAAARQRFEREAKAAARLHHTNIVPVFAVGEEGGTPYYAMQFIDGRPLDALLRQLRGGGDREPAAAGVLTVSVAAGVSPTPTPTASPASGEASTGGASPAPGPVGHFREVARLGLQAAEALAYAHGQGVLHRDIKPANLLLDRQGDLWVTDFGLAKAGNGDGLTGTGDVVGTLRYLAPERFRGQCDARSEVYSLGLTLYELATLRPAFDEVDQPRLVQQIARHDLARPRRLAPAMPVDLETVVLKACLAEPERRYATAAALAEDLRRFLEGRPVLARPVGLAGQAARWARRNPVPAVAAAAVVVTLLVGSVVSTYFGIDASNEARQARASEATARDREADAVAARLEAEGEKRAALFQKRRAEEARHAIQLDLALRAWEQHDVAEAERVLGEVGPEFRQTWEHRHLEGLCRRKALSLPGYQGLAIVARVAFSADGSRLAYAGGDGVVRVWDVKAGREALSLRAPGKLGGMAFSGDGMRLATGGADRAVRVWDARTGQLVLTLQGHVGQVVSVAFDPDGRRIVSGGQGAGTSGEVRVWDARTGRTLLALDRPSGAVWRVAFAPDGKRIAAGGQGGAVTVWDAQTGRDVLTLGDESKVIYGLAFSPDGRRIVAGSPATVWDTQTGKVEFTLPTSLLDVAFSPDGQRLATVGDGQAVLVWDARDGQRQLTLRGHRSSPLSAVAFSPDGRLLAEGAYDGAVRLWDPQARQETLALPRRASIPYCMALAPDGDRIATGNLDGTVTIWDARGGREVLTVGGHTRYVLCLAFSPDGRLIASGGQDRTVRVWDARTGQHLRTCEGHLELVRGVAFGPGGARIVSGGADGTVRLWDARTGRQELTIRANTIRGHQGEVTGVAFAPDGQTVASAGGDGTVRVWDTRTGEAALTFRDHACQVLCVAFDAVGGSIASGDSSGLVRVWDPRTGEGRHLLRSHAGGVSAVAFSPDGRRIVSGGSDGAARSAVKLWDAHTGQHKLSLNGHSGLVWKVAFSGDGQRIASVDNHGMVAVWDAEPAAANPPAVPAGR